MLLSFLIRKLKKLWDSWDLRLCIVASLSLQAFLMLLAPFRQRSRSNLLFTSIWATYLLADWVAAVSIGLISKSLANPTGLGKDNDDLYALWASFLLIHLGGPDGITSLSLEDNELWVRHLFGLSLQVASAAYSFYLTLNNTKVWLPTVLVFIVGLIKYGGRTLALRLASLERFGSTALPDPNPGPDYQEAAVLYSTMRSVQVSTLPVAEMTTVSGTGFGEETTSATKNLDEMKLLEAAYSHFQNFKGLIVGLLLTSKDRDSSRNQFLNEEYDQAFRLVEYELSFMYNVLHTKAIVIHELYGYFLRSISICFIISASLWFLMFIDKNGFGDVEVTITYALFFGAIFLDAISVVKLFLSDWILMVLKDRWIMKILMDNEKNWFLKDNWIVKRVSNMILKRKRWADSVSQSNMISYCLPPTIKEIFGYLGKYGILETTKMVLFFKSSSSETIPEDLKKFLFEKIQDKSKKASNLRDATEACSQRGDSAVLESSSSYIKLKWSIGEFQYAESLLLWHLATDLCYHGPREDKTRINSKTNRVHDSSNTTSYGIDDDQDDHQDSSNRSICKLVSDYMFYLLVNKPAMLAPVLGNWKILFRDTRAEAKRFFNKNQLSSYPEACQKILSVQPNVRSATIKGNRSKSVLFDACILAQQLQTEPKQWEVMSGVWVELLSYAAINCRPFVHAQQLSKGGELLTFTWLLMNHLGLGTQFAEQEQQVGSNMVTIVG